MPVSHARLTNMWPSAVFWFTGCLAIGQYVLHPTNRCQYVHCVFSAPVWGTSRSEFVGVARFCPYGTAVPQERYIRPGGYGTFHLGAMCSEWVANPYWKGRECKGEIWYMYNLSCDWVSPFCLVIGGFGPPFGTQNRDYTLRSKIMIHLLFIEVEVCCVWTLILIINWPIHKNKDENHIQRSRLGINLNLRSSCAIEIIVLQAKQGLGLSL